MTITTGLLDEIEAGCERVTPGPWAVNGAAVMFDHRQEICCGRGYHQCCGEPEIEGEADFLPETTDDAAHIARLDPATVRELVRLARIGMKVEARRRTLAELTRLGQEIENG